MLMEDHFRIPPITTRWEQQAKPLLALGAAWFTSKTTLDIAM